MKQIISISLLLFFLSNSFFKAALFFDFWNNKSEIIAKCCVNKNKPELQCEGKCYVGSQMNKIDANAKSDLPTKLVEKDFELFFTPFFSYHVKSFNMDILPVACISKAYAFEFESKVFQPPTA